MAINTIDFSNWPDWDDINWQESIYRSLSNKRDGEGSKRSNICRERDIRGLGKKRIQALQTSE